MILICKIIIRELVYRYLGWGGRCYRHSGVDWNFTSSLWFYVVQQLRNPDSCRNRQHARTADTESPVMTERELWSVSNVDAIIKSHRNVARTRKKLYGDFFRYKNLCWCSSKIRRMDQLPRSLADVDKSVPTFQSWMQFDQKIFIFNSKPIMIISSALNRAFTIKRSIQIFFGYNNSSV